MSSVATLPRDFRVLFEAHFAYVWGALRRLGVPEADTEDLVHDVFLAVHRRLGDYDPARAMRPWLFGFAYRLASDYRRRAHVRREVLESVERVDPAAPADERIAAHQERQLLLDALDALDLDRRAILVLHEWDGVPVPEAATALGIPLNTAYSRLRAAREDLADAVKRLRARRGR